MKISSKTRLNLLIGYPLAHSQSPLLHYAAYQALDIEAVLLAQTHLSLEALIQSIKTLSIGLTAVTLPYKEEVIQYLDECSPEVKSLKAANTIIQRNNKLYGYNTDIDGIAFALRNCSLKNKKMLIIGAGGAARAMGYFLKNQHVHVFWLNRTKEKAEILANEFSGNVIDYRDCNKHVFDIVINTTSVGLYPNVYESPVTNEVFHTHQIVFDMVYNPIETTFLKQAVKKQATIISGLDMFIGQGLKQIELLTGKTHTPDLIDHLRKLLISNQ